MFQPFRMEQNYHRFIDLGNYVYCEYFLELIIHIFILTVLA